ncbi:MAG: hypothetical protein R3Y51_04300 [Rikenellaceae bacterium]
MKLNIFIFSLYITAVFSFECTAQVNARFSELAGDTTYMSLLTKEKELIAKQDSLNTIIKEKRSEIASADTDLKESLSSEIMSLENQVFDIRGTIGELSTKTASIEKLFLLNNMNTIKTETVESEIESEEKRFLVKNDYFKSALEVSEYNIIVNSQITEAKIDVLADQITKAYNIYKQNNDYFRTAGSKTEADSLIEVIDSLKMVILELDNKVGSIWSKLYQTKLDAYNVLLDKMGKYDEIENFGNKSRNERNKISEIQSVVIDPSLSSYLRGNLILNEYELALANARNLTLAKDSISQKMKNIDVAKYDFMALEVPDWTFIEYEPAIIGTTTIYNTNNPIPDLVVPTVGELYKINLGTYVKKQTAYHIFRKVSPIELREEAEGKVTYFAGSYKTYEEAKKMNDKLARYGMKVSVARWKDGNQVSEDGSIIDVKPAGDGYNVVISELSDETLTIIKEKAEDKEVMKNTEGYSIGLFDSYDTAKSLADEIGNGAKVIGIKFND